MPAHKTARALSAATRKRIFGRCKELGIDADLRHAVQHDVCGKASLTEFTEDDGRRMLNHLGKKDGREKKEKRLRLRLKYTRPDGIVVIHVKPDARQKSTRFAFAQMHQIIASEKWLIEKGAFPRPEGWNDNAGARLDGWSKTLTKGEAARISELMQEELERMIVQLRNRNGWLTRKQAAASRR